MYPVLKIGKLKAILSLALKKSGNIRKLEKEIRVPRSTLSGYNMENRLPNKNNLEKLVKYLGIKMKKEDIKKELPKNWRQIKGGKNCVKIKKKEGRFGEQLKLCQKGSSKYMINWHKKMKKDNPEKYYAIQHNRFKKIGKYKFKTKNGEIVRNKFERDIANILINLNLNYMYEPLIRIDNRSFFPDFLINNKIIIECTAWKGTDKAIKLKQKIKYLNKKYRVYVVIPKHLNSYYQILNQYLIEGLDKFVPVAQTFRDLK